MKNTKKEVTFWDIPKGYYRSKWPYITLVVFLLVNLTWLFVKDKVPFELDLSYFHPLISLAPWIFVFLTLVSTAVALVCFNTKDKNPTLNNKTEFYKEVLKKFNDD